jgi:hypothetical protein
MRSPRCATATDGFWSTRWPFRILGSSDAEDIVKMCSPRRGAAARYQPGRGVVVAWLMNMARSRATIGCGARTTQPQSLRSGDSQRDSDTAQPIDEQVVWAGRAEVVRAALDALPLLRHGDRAGVL